MSVTDADGRREVVVQMVARANPHLARKAIDALLDGLRADALAMASSELEQLHQRMTELAAQKDGDDSLMYSHYATAISMAIDTIRGGATP